MGIESFARDSPQMQSILSCTHPRDVRMQGKQGEGHSWRAGRCGRRRVWKRLLKLGKAKVGLRARWVVSTSGTSQTESAVLRFSRALDRSETSGAIAGRIATCGDRVECNRAVRCPNTPGADGRSSVRGRAAFPPTGRSIRKCAEWRRARGTWSPENPSTGR